MRFRFAALALLLTVPQSAIAGCPPDKKVSVNEVTVETKAPGDKASGLAFLVYYTVRWNWQSKEMKDGTCQSLTSPGMLIGYAEMRLKPGWDPKRIDSYRTKLKENFYLPKNAKFEQTAICQSARMAADSQAQCAPASGNSPLVSLTDLVAMNAPQDQAVGPVQELSVKYLTAVNARLASQ
jgi:hypothetical protein